jgi:cysteinyl-tRNA synthetase
MRPAVLPHRDASGSRFVRGPHADAQRRALLLDCDRVLGLDLGVAPPKEAPLAGGAAELLERRATARAARDYAAYDALRQELAALGVEVRDTPDGQEFTTR